jgi:hypothetical protein
MLIRVAQNYVVLWVCVFKALQKDRPWIVKESRVLEILQAVRKCKDSDLGPKFQVFGK